MSDKKYSDWLRLDLHIHTDKSKETKNGDYKGNFDVSTLKTKLIENQVEIFSLTDHNIINVEAYEEYYKSYTDDDPLLLVGVELDIEGCTGKTYHSLLIFNYADIENTKKVSQQLEKKYQGKNITNPFDRKLTFDDIIENFKNDEFFFIPHAKKGGHQNIVDADLPNIQNTQRMILLMQSALEKVTAQEMKEAYQKGFDLLQADEFKNKKDIAYINFSDNHYIEQYPCRHMGEKGNHEFDYIKGQKSYETIRLAFIDPQSRIKSQSEYNSLNKTINTIDNLKINSHEYFNENELFFSPHLNVVIGGRSSGKSLLMNLIGGKIDSLTTIKQNGYDKFHGEHISIKAKRDDRYKQQTAIEKPIYINQGDIVDYFEKNSLKELAEKSDKKPAYDEAKAKFVTHKNDLQSIIQEMINKYKDIQEFNVKKFELHKKNIDSIDNSSYTINLNIECLKATNETTISELDTTKMLVDSLIENLVSFNSNKYLEIIETEKSVIEAFQCLINEKLALIKTKQKNKNRIDTFISEVEEIIEDANSTLSEESQQKVIAKSSIKSFEDNVKEYFSKYARLKEATKTIESFDYSKKETIEIDENVSLNLEVEKNENLELIDTILEAIKSANLSDSLYINLVNLLKNKLSIKNHTGNESTKLSQKINATLSALLTLIETPKDYLAYKDDETSKSKSPGFNSEKYLGILLKNAKNKIIFIDQPEDNLGNKFISEELVATIRDIKFKNQIFLVTHNPSIVVYGDAENIIIAKNSENKISYEQIVLEEVKSQKEICSILDGGEYIFDNRAKKYNIQRILKENSSQGNENG